MTAADYRKEMSLELQSILRYWMDYAVVPRQGGFIGRVDENDHPHPLAPKGLVMNARILWTFSAAYRQTDQWIYRPVADRACEYLVSYFLDPEFGGAYWSLDHSGQPLNDRKQIYGLAFCIYAFSEYYRAAGEQQALDHAIALFRIIELYSFDRERKGYNEAFARDWSPLEDLRLSEKDANEQKTMNNHLHLLEAYTNLYQSWPDPVLKQQMITLLEVFAGHIIDSTTGHLGLFFDKDWNSRSVIISYGHDIEAAWLLYDAAVVIGDRAWIERTRELSLKITAAAAEGLDKDGGLWYEKDKGRLISEKHWWPQAEAMVGFLNAWQLSGDKSWWQRSLDSWSFVKQYIRHPGGREWYWGVNADHTPMAGQDKAGFWKCPYHNTRACLEIMSRLDGLTEEQAEQVWTF